MLFSQLNNHRIFKRMHRLVWASAGRTYHIVGNLMSRLIWWPIWYSFIAHPVHRELLLFPGLASTNVFRSHLMQTLEYIHCTKFWISGQIHCEWRIYFLIRSAKSNLKNLNRKLLSLWRWAWNILYFHGKSLNEPLHLRCCSYLQEKKLIQATPTFTTFKLTNVISSNNVSGLLTFVWHWTRIAMKLSTEIWHFCYSKSSFMSDLIQNIWKTSQVRWKLKMDTWLIK